MQGKVVKGQPTCAYHGWKYNSKGECTEMPSTMMCPGIRVNHMACAEADGVVWVARAGADPPLRLPKNPAAALDGMTVVSRVQVLLPPPLYPPPPPPFFSLPPCL